jgi:RNA polymerase-binding transcription factor DksA
MRVVSEFEWQQQSQLLDQRDRSERLLEGLRVAATSRPDYEPHDITDDEAAIQADAIEGRLTAINTALGRIDSGTYGACLTCGSTIARKRLEALPAAASCRECAA